MAGICLARRSLEGKGRRAPRRLAGFQVVGLNRRGKDWYRQIGQIFRVP